MEKVQNRLSIVPYAGITQIRCGRSLTLPLRLYTDSHILYGHMIAQNKKKCQGNCLQKRAGKFPTPIFYTRSPSLFTL